MEKHIHSKLPGKLSGLESESDTRVKWHRKCENIDFWEDLSDLEGKFGQYEKKIYIKT